MCLETFVHKKHPLKVVVKNTKLGYSEQFWCLFSAALPCLTANYDDEIVMTDIEVGSCIQHSFIRSAICSCSIGLIYQD